MINVDEDSFGLNVGTEDFAKDYGSTMTIRYKVIKCKVRYEDVGRIVHDEKKKYVVLKLKS